MKTSKLYRTIGTGGKRIELIEDGEGLRGANGQFVPYAAGTKMPVFACEVEDANEYAIQDAANIHENSLRWVFDTFGTDEPTLRKALVARLGLKKGMKLLVTGAGAGNDLPYLVESMGGSGVIYAQDIAKQMLLAAVERYDEKLNTADMEIYFSASDATDLPFDDDTFDAAYHFGGINLFPNIRKGIAEMDRVVKAGGKIVISDEGAAPWFRDTELGKMLINNNYLYGYEAPLAMLPENARDVHLSWELSGCFFVIEFTVANGPLDINVDVPHVGKRGGSIRTRYFGQLEGVDPALKARVYEEAAKQGISRVEFIERALKKDCN